MPDQKENSAARTLFAEERHVQILQLLHEKTKLHVAELCEQFSVSPATIRNDLRDLEAAGRLKRTHGGAIPLEKTAFEPNTHAKTIANRAVKQRLAAHAATLIEENDTIALDSGTTMMELAKCLFHHKSLTVLTNDLHGLMFVLDRSAPDGTGNYGYGPLYFVVMACFLLELLASVGILFRKTKDSPRRHAVVVPLALIAALAWHDKQADDAAFSALLPVIVAGAADERNYVKKAVSWALRHIGKRNAALYATALRTAQELAASDSRPARWIARETVKDLNSAAAQRRRRG